MYQILTIFSDVFESIKRLAENYFALWVILGSIIGFFNADVFSWALPHISLFLGIIMFGMGMSLKFDDFKIVLQRPKDVFLGMGLQFTLMPLLAYIIALALQLPPELAVGVILLGCCPGGTASNVITYLARGDVALSVAITTFCTVASPLITPILTLILAHQWVGIPASSMIQSIFLIVLLPVTLGLVLNGLMGKKLEPFRSSMPLVSVVAIILIVGAIIGVNADKIVTSGLLVLLAVILHNGLGLLISYGITKKLGISEAKRRAIVVEVGVQNSGLSVALATQYFSPFSAVPGAIFSVWHNITGPLLANYWTKKDKELEEKNSKK
ncbi:bile acid:sodium symporter family protein [Methanococcus voltae]|uniref:BASS family bile acid:Na+ symporter n=2 Tax=Methanococcus voltae TaxID=2188 RepID=A0A8J7RF19_METVO|nr:bile acid:sodium symporter family protein [Methanococcus voltae]MBP2173171.1 BASS family bile acid:Na+ symporter [Methanococcus voltae]MBP2202037.1 BASS family bile acid:Na+ symporter [Methanococcus voltae]MCS3922874.1 BASS family bile acid:Na+ symporter [Methanococcus voltae PS]